MSMVNPITIKQFVWDYAIGDTTNYSIDDYKVMVLMKVS